MSRSLNASRDSLEKSCTINITIENGEKKSVTIPISTTISSLKHTIREHFPTIGYEFDISTTGDFNEKITNVSFPICMANNDCRRLIKSGEPIPIFVHPNVKLGGTFHRIKDQKLVSGRSPNIVFPPHPFKSSEGGVSGSGGVQQQQQQHHHQQQQQHQHQHQHQQVEKEKNEKEVIEKSCNNKVETPQTKAVVPKLQTEDSRSYSLLSAKVTSSSSGIKFQRSSGKSEASPVENSDNQNHRPRSSHIRSPRRGIMLSTEQPESGGGGGGSGQTISQNEMSIGNAHHHASTPSFYWVNVVSATGVITKLQCSANAKKQTFIDEAVQQLQKVINNLLSGDLVILENDGSMYGKRYEIDSDVELLYNPEINKSLVNQQIPTIHCIPDMDTLLGGMKKMPSATKMITATPEFDIIVKSSPLATNLYTKTDPEKLFFRENIIPIAKTINPATLLSIPYTPTTTVGWNITELPPTFTAKFFYDLHHSKTILCTENNTVLESMKTVLNTCPIEDMKLRPPTDFFLKLSNRNEYFHPKMMFGSCLRIREFIRKFVPIRFNIIPISEISSKYLITDPSDEYSPHHDEIDKFAVCNIDSRFTHQNQYELVTNLNYNFQVKIVSVGIRTSLSTNTYTDFYQVEVNLYHGSSPLCPAIWSKPNNCLKFNEWIGTPSLRLSQLPRATKVAFTVYVRKYKELTPIGSVNFQYFDFMGNLRTGNFKLPLWPNIKANPLSPCALNYENVKLLYLNVEFPTFDSKPIIFPVYRHLIYSNTQPTHHDHSVNANLSAILAKDPLCKLSRKEKSSLWSSRAILTAFPSALPKVLSAVDWTNPSQTEEALRLLPTWKILNATAALQLLDSHFPVPEVREFAVNCLRRLSDIELGDYLLQLVQVLKYEPYHDSALSRFLLQRGIENRSRIGHPLFWYLRSELNIPDTCERNLLFLEAYLSGCGNNTLRDLLLQNKLSMKLQEIAEAVKQEKPKYRTPLLFKELLELHLPSAIQLPISTSYSVSRIVVDKCKVMSSFTVPLWVAFESSELAGEFVNIIFKCGDDLRSDILTLQMFRLMDKLWLSSGLDLQLTPYFCTATDLSVGMIEVVPNCMTVAAIQRAYAGVPGALLKRGLKKWLKEQNPEKKDRDSAILNFVHSLAGYCVATYVLGIADRHNDNIMITKSGHLFHIDFAHFLGNYLTFQGIKREKAPFVLTQEFVYVMGVSQKKDRKNSAYWQKFVSLCQNGFNVLRKHSHLFITLFSMMLSTGIPNMSTDEDLEYLQTAFCLDKTDEEAAKIFEDLIEESLNTKTTTVNFFFHNVAQAKASLAT